MAQLHDLTAVEQAEQVRGGSVSPVELTEHYLDRIERLNETVGAYITVTPEIARKQAADAESEAVAARREGRELPPLHGVPVPVKDLNFVAGVRCTLGSRAYADHVPDIDDHVVTKLREAGTILLGKTNTPEFGLPCYTENQLAPPARTPWDLELSAGGSSGAPPRRSRPGWRRSRRAVTAAARSASPRRSAGCSASSRAGDGSAAARCSTM